ncbi:MAG: sensor histidine kinase [Chloroflexi bacterium]|nr:sensor histidine kinase [Chloroflexota bacterium]
MEGDSEDRRLLRLAGLALPAAVLVLGLVPPPRGGLTQGFLLSFVGFLVALVVVDQTAPAGDAPGWRRGIWFGAELALSALVVHAHGTLVRPALIYLLPTSRALLMFGERTGLLMSLTGWLVYSFNIGASVWPDRLNEFPNYLSFFLGPYVVAVLLTMAALRQAAERRKVQTLYDELKEAHQQLQAMHQQAQELAVTQERNRLAREIHDTLAHYLTVINVQLEAVEKQGSDRPEEALQRVRRARRLAVECLQEVRHSVAALRAATMEELSLPKALQNLALEFTESTGIAVRLEMELPDEMPLPPEMALALYRAAQEGLTNVQRHAHAQQVILHLSAHNDAVELAVQDNGRGPNEESSAGSGGFGLLGLRERVALLGGQLAFGRAQAGGSRLAVTLPAQNARD